MRDPVREELPYADEALSAARKILAIGLPRVAGREDYLALFHAATAFVIHHEGQAPRTHKGLHRRFAELLKQSTLPGDIGRLLVRQFELKSVSDYFPSKAPSVEDIDVALIRTEQAVGLLKEHLLGRR
ncbi:MAG: HEPN domain-containing protein [Deinococcus-Thermus bacterium]|nr:HEPN domain-containing protein [Deinococcota bacterium]